MNTPTITIVLLCAALLLVTFNWLMSAFRAWSRGLTIEELTDKVERMNESVDGIEKAALRLIKAHEVDIEERIKAPRMFLLKEPVEGEPSYHYVGRGRMGKCPGCDTNFIDLIFGEIPEGITLLPGADTSKIQFQNVDPQIVLRVHDVASGRQLIKTLTEITDDLEKANTPAPATEDTLAGIPTSHD